MTAVITGCEALTCFGDRQQTFAALLAGRCGAAPIRHLDGARLGVTHGYQIRDGDEELPRRPSRWLTHCVAGAVRASGLDPTGRRISALVGTGLREIRELERWEPDDEPPHPAGLHFTGAVRSVLPETADVITLANACAASGHALALACDLLAVGDADAVLVAGSDGFAASMLASMGRMAAGPTDRVRPFDRHRTGALLGEGAAALVLEPESAVAAEGRTALARVRGVGLSCDARHATAPDPDGITRAVRDAHRRAGVTPQDVDLVIAHGTGTALNDPVEATVLHEVFTSRVGAGPLLTAFKGAIGHTSGSSALHSVAVALDILRTGHVPPATGLRRPIGELRGVRAVIGDAGIAPVRCAQVNGFGFGGVNAVLVLEAMP
ncbi:beta-ketoacyl synthase N-terminal-like domain-containing protein [Streptomyces sp. NPDC018019]|uniref:beta-ketoacyl synthase N-terminal-like domain-containing protein n=1 Tax=Streptomyces sp. NPDC018019 TaxID=3365030 RepID=UPI003794A4F9